MVRFARLLALVCLLGASLIPAAAAAQGSVAPQSVAVALWPEYDQRAMLVIYRISLPAGTALPATVRVPIPAHVGEPGAVAQEGGDGALVLADYTRQAPDGDWATLTIQAESERLQVEFYDVLSMEGDLRSYVLTWPDGWPVADLIVEVQRPYGVDSLQIDPALAGERVGADGLTYFTGSLGAQDGTSEASLRLSYTASAFGLSADALATVRPPEEPAIRAAETSATTSQWLDWAPWLVGGLGAALLVSAAVLLWRTRREEAGLRRARHPSGKRKETGSSTLDVSTVFCHSCGTAASASDDYCRRCGTRLRA